MFKNHQTQERTMRINKYLDESENEESVKTINGVAVCYQPQYEAKEWQRMSFKDNYVYRRRKNAQIDFPSLKIVRYFKDDFENAIYLD